MDGGIPKNFFKLNQNQLNYCLKQKKTEMNWTHVKCYFKSFKNDCQCDTSVCCPIEALTIGVSSDRKIYFCYCNDTQRENVWMEWGTAAAVVEWRRLLLT